MISGCLVNSAIVHSTAVEMRMIDSSKTRLSIELVRIHVIIPWKKPVVMRSGAFGGGVLDMMSGKDFEPSFLWRKNGLNTWLLVEWDWFCVFL